MVLHKIVAVWVDKSTTVRIATLSSLHVGLATLSFVTGWLQMNVCIQLSLYKPLQEVGEVCLYALYFYSLSLVLGDLVLIYLIPELWFVYGIILKQKVEVKIFLV